MQPSPFWAQKVQEKTLILRDSPGAIRKFRANALSMHIDDSNGALPGRKRAEEHAIQAWKTLRHGIRAGLHDLSIEIPAGHPTTTTLAGKPRTTGSIEFAYLVSKIADANVYPRTVVEFGGGYGGFARAAQMVWGCQYTIVDFPPMHAIQREYLGSVGLTFDAVAPGDVVPHAELYVATRSFFEMTLQQIGFYIDQMRGPSHFFSLNKDKVTRMRDWPIPKDWGRVHVEKYPHNRSFLLEIYSIP